MAISFVAAGAVATGSNAVVPVPAGYAAGDILVIAYTSATTVSTPTGWTRQRSQVASSTSLNIYTKTATASESSVTFTSSGSTTCAVMLAYRGATGVDITTTINTATGTTIPTVTGTTTVTNEYVISFYCSNPASGSWTAPASTNNRVSSAASGTVNGALVVDESQAAAGATTARTATISASSTLAASSITLVPSDRYWVGGAGTWDTTTTTNWATSSGGTGGQPVPTANNSVFFDSATTYTVTCTGALTCNDITVSAGTVVFATGTSPTFAISGSMSLVAGTVWSATGNITFNATTTGKTITTNNISIGGTNSIIFNGVGGAWTLGSAFTTTKNIVVTAGTFSTSASNYAVTVSSASTNNFTISGGTLTLNGSTINCQGTTALTYTSGTINAGTSQINCGGTNSTFAGGGQTYYNVSFTNTIANSVTITGANTFNNFSLIGQQAPNISNVTFNSNQTINGTFSLPAGTNATGRTFIKSDTFNTTRTLTCAAFAATDGDFQDITIAGAAAPASGTRLGDCKGNSGITFSAGKTVYWVLGTSQNWTDTGWASSSGGTGSVNNFPLAQDTAIFTSTSPTSGNTITIATGHNIGTINMSARTSNTMTLATGTQTPTIYGDWINGTGTTLTGTGNMTFSGRTTQQITSNGKSFTQILSINSPLGTVILQDALTASSATAPAFVLTNGTLDLNGKTLTVSGSATGFSIQAGTKNITFNGGTLLIAGISGFGNVQPTGFTTTAGTGTGVITLTSASAKTFAGGGSTFNCTLNQGGAGALTITGSNTFGDIKSTYAQLTGATTITFPASTTTTVAGFTGTGASGRLLTLNSSTAGTQATIALTGGGTVTTPDYLNVKDLSFTPFVTDGTAPYKWYAGANSTNSGNNRGIAFVAGATVLGAYLITSGTSWTVPSDWNNANNTIHMIGGGGGGAGGYVSGANRAGGGGGGGGGYTKLTNQTLSGTVTYVIGPAGTAGAANGNGGDGGTTSWNAGASTAGGGGGGQTTTTPTSTGGTAGTGTTFNGGAGGAGGTTTTTLFSGGGGGGGAGGPNGAGGTGGLGFTSSNNSAAGGGGGGNGGGANGAAGATAVGGSGGNNFAGIGGSTTANTAGTFGGGGIGSVGTSATWPSGGAGIDISNTVGGGGGMGGGSIAAPSTFANNGLYGSGGAGAGGGATARAGAAGTQGMIFIIYSPGTTTTFGDFFLLF